MNTLMNPYSTRRILILISTIVSLAGFGACAPENESASMTKSLGEVLPAFAVGILAGPDSPREWIVLRADGSYQDAFRRPSDLIKHFSSLPIERQKDGIIIWGALTHLRDAEASKVHMTDHMKKQFGDAIWLEAERLFVTELADACKAKSIKLWINTELGTKDIRFINLALN